MPLQTICAYETKTYLSDLLRQFMQEARAQAAPAAPPHSSACKPLAH